MDEECTDMPEWTFNKENHIVLTFSENDDIEKSLSFWTGQDLYSFKADTYNCFTICVEELKMYSGVNVAIGICSEQFEVTDDIHSSRNNCWFLDSFGVVQHNEVELISPDYRIQQRDMVTIHVDLINYKLLYAINGHFLGVQYINLPKSAALHPLVGASGRCRVRLMNAFASHSSLQLLSYLSLTTALMKSDEKYPSLRKRIMTRGEMQFLRPGLVELNLQEILPVGLIRRMTNQYPWISNVQLRRYSTRRWKSMTTIPKLIDRSNQYRSVPRISGTNCLHERAVASNSYCVCGIGVHCSRCFLNLQHGSNEFTNESSDDDGGELFIHLKKCRQGRRKRS